MRPLAPASALPAAPPPALAERIHAALPQTQCTRCGYPDCHAYAEAVAHGVAGINQCPPGGAEGVVRLAELTGSPVLPLSADHGDESPRALAFIDEAWCIGCTLCIDACPTDAIVGTHKRMHTVIESHCTGCELCIPVCPVDCIQLENASGTATGWAAWSPAQAAQALQRYQRHRARRPLKGAGDAEDGAAAASAAPGPLAGAEDPDAAPSKNTADAAKAQAARQASIAAALERARQLRRSPPAR